MFQNKKKLWIIIMVLILLIFIAYTIIMFPIRTLTTYSKTGANFENEICNISISMNGFKERYNNYNFNDSDVIAKVSFISQQKRHYFGSGNNRIYFDTVTPKLQNEYKNMIVTDSICTMKVTACYKGNLEVGKTIQILMFPTDKCIKSLNDTAEKIVMLKKEREKPFLYFLPHSDESIYFVVYNRIFPALDITYEKKYGYLLKGYGNPVAKYKGMKVNRFIREILK